MLFSPKVCQQIMLLKDGPEGFFSYLYVLTFLKECLIISFSLTYLSSNIAFISCNYMLCNEISPATIDFSMSHS